MRPRLAIAIAVLLLSRALPASARELSAIDGHAVVRTGGWLGLATVGLGIGLLDDRVRLTATYGFIPAAIGGENLHELAIGATVRAPTVRSGRWRWVPLYGGATLLVTPDRDTFVMPPARYPDGYYAPTALHALTVAGTELGVARGESAVQHAVFVELAGLGRFWARWVGNGRIVGLDDVLSPALGWVMRW